MNRKTFFRFIEKGTIQGACRYPEYWFVYQNVEKGDKVLELGAGTSALAKSMKSKGCDVTITEASKGCMLYQKTNEVKAVLVTDTKLEFEDASFDVVVSASSIEHFDPDNDKDIEAIKEAHRVLKPGGLFIVTIPVHKTYIKNRYAGHPIHPPEKVYDEAEYKKRFLGSFKEVKREYWKWSSKPTDEYVSHPSWVQRGDIISTEPVGSFDEAHGLCAVLKK